MMSAKTKGYEPKLAAGERQYEAWETLAPLDEVQRDSVRDIQKHCMELPLPPSLCTELPPNIGISIDEDKTPEVTNRVITPSQLGLLGSFNSFQGLSPSVSVSGNNSRNSPCFGLTTAEDNLTVGSKFMPEKPIVSTSSFLLWFSNIEPNLITGQDDIYRRHQHTLLGYEEKCSELLSDLHKVKNILDMLLARQQEITEKTKPIREVCFDILKSQSTLEKNLALIEKQLKPFDQLSHIYHFLSRPGNDICLHPLFISTLQQMDSGIAFLKTHENYKDAKIYLSRYQQCMTRALSMIHIHLSERITELKTEFLKSKESTPLAAELADGYQQFRYLASEVRPLILHLEVRAAENPDHVNLLVDCYEILSRNRGLLIKKLLPDIAPDEDIFNSLVDGTAHMHSILRDEETLFRSFFVEGENELRNYLDDLLSNFYELWADRLTKWIKTSQSTPIYTTTLNDIQQFLASPKNVSESTYFKKTHQTIQNILNLINSKLN